MNQSRAPIWIVAAITAHPKIRHGLGGGALSLLGFVGAGSGCTDRSLLTATVPILDDVGNGTWAQVSAGLDHTCALTTDGRAYCWGSNSHGQLGVGQVDSTCQAASESVACSLVPAAVGTGAARFRSISAGGRHTCAVAEDWTAFCWGDNTTHALGNGSGSGGATLQRVPGIIAYGQISAGLNHTCAIRGDGGVWCWGGNERGQVGIGTTLPRAQPIRVGSPTSFASVSAGRSRTCARTTMGMPYCWGGVWVQSAGAEEQFRTQLTPQAVPGAPALASLSVGSFTTCGFDASGFAYCWEANPRGQMGTGSTQGSTTPKRVIGRREFVALSAGFVQTCGVTAGGAGYCWGDDSFGQLGASSIPPADRCSDPSLPCVMTPVPVYGRQQFTMISTGMGGHACGVTTRNNLYCWGFGSVGQRGDGTSRARVRLPVLVQ